MFKKIRDLEPEDIFIMSYFSDLKMGRVIGRTMESVKVELCYSTNSDIRDEDAVIKEIKYISPYRFVFKIN